MITHKIKELRDEINLFSRNKDLENSIDFKMILKFYSSSSIFVFLNAMEILIIDYNNDQDYYSKKKLMNFVDIFDRNFNEEQTHILTHEEVGYWRAVYDYAKELKSLLFKDKHKMRHIISNIVHIVTKKISYESTSEDIVEIINSVMQNTTNIRYSISENSGNVTLYLIDIKYKVYVLNKSKFFEIEDFTNKSAIIINDNFGKFLSNVTKTTKVTLVAFRRKPTNDYFTVIDIYSPFSECIELVYDFMYRDKIYSDEFEKNLDERINYILAKIKFIAHKIPFYDRNIDKETLGDIKHLRMKLHKTFALVDDIRPYKKALYKIDTLITLYINNATSTIELNRNIYSCLSEIRRNNTLYIVSKSNLKTVDFAFGEENLSSILASNLRCLYHYRNHFTVNCESTVGNGRSDIRINWGNRTIGLIESKLLRSNKSGAINYETETRNGIEQLYSRYSENENLIESKDIELYLILFSYDSNFRSLSKKVKVAIDTYASKNELIYEQISSTENGIRFSYTEIREDNELTNKTRVIDIIICNLEIDYKTKSKERTKK